MPRDEDDGELRDMKIVQDDPGATLMWFSKHENTRLDEPDEGYRRVLLHFYKERPWIQNFVKFKALHDKYIDWCDERKSPMSTVIWFGKFKRHEMRFLYDRRPRRWRWLLNNCGKWREDPSEILQRYQKWRAKHSSRGRPKSGRRPGVVLNPMGEKLGLTDDEIASDNDESYDSDDGFVVRSDHAESENEDSDDSDTSEDAFEYDLDSEDKESAIEEDDAYQRSSEALDHLRHDREGSSSSSLPSLDAIFKSSPVPAALTLEPSLSFTYEPGFLTEGESENSAIQKQPKRLERSQRPKMVDSSGSSTVSYKRSRCLDKTTDGAISTQSKIMPSDTRSGKTMIHDKPSSDEEGDVRPSSFRQRLRYRLESPPITRLQLQAGGIASGSDDQPIGPSIRRHWGRASQLPSRTAQSNHEDSLSDGEPIILHLQKKLGNNGIRHQKGQQTNTG